MTRINIKCSHFQVLPLLLLSPMAFAQEMEAPGETPEETTATEPADEAAADDELNEAEQAPEERIPPDEGAEAESRVGNEPEVRTDSAAGAESSVGLEQTPPEADQEATQQLRPPPALEAPAPDTADAKPSLWPFNVGASFFVRAEFREGYDRLGVSRTRFQEGDLTVFRTRLSLASQVLPLVDDVGGMVQFTPQASGIWGTSGIGGTIGEANLGLYEGYFKVTSRSFDVKAGRFAMNYGDALVIGNLGWHQSARAFDGLHSSLKLQKGKIDLFATQLASGWPVVNEPIFAGDAYFWGAYAGLGGYINEKFDLDAYLLGLSVAATDGLVDEVGTPFDREGATLFHLGARVKHAVGILDYRLETGLQVGETATGTAAVSTLAYHVDGEFGLTPAKGTRVAIGGVFASGDDPTTTENEGYFEMFPTGHKFLGLMDVFGSRTNAASGNLKFSTKLTESLALNLDGHLFARVEDGGLGRSGSDSLAGGEMDFQLAQKIGDYVSVRGLYGIFLPNEDHYGSGDAAHFVELQAGLQY